ncbi:kirola-like [Solanum pennellii]|uniref:Kirola-like n=1 Tax=Solanum pennellii TaxID=28526 RepID=A0ABM1HLK0_SOLPN|nr:kirola-like [Solanum pennellii]
MSLKSVLCAKIEMKANKDVFHDVFTNKPHHISTMCPLHVQGCELLEGVFGTVGSKICWRYTLEGKEKISRQVIECIDEEKKVITFKEFEGDLVNTYDNWQATLHIETKGEIDLVSWTMEYERPNENVPELINLLDFIIGMTKAVDDHHVKMN